MPPQDDEFYAGFATLLSGLYPRSTGIFEESFDSLASEITILPEYLQSRGYLTLGMTSNPNLNAVFGFDQGYTDYRDSAANWPWMKKEGKDGKTGDHSTAMMFVGYPFNLESDSVRM